MPLADRPAIRLRQTTTGQGAAWIGTGFSLFGRAPGTWIGIIIVYFVLSLMVAFVPGGSLLSTLFGPVLGGGLMLGCAALANGEELKLEHLFAGFTSGRIGSLLLIGALVMAGGFLIVVLCGGTFLISLLSGQWHSLTTEPQPALGTMTYTDFSAVWHSAHFSVAGILLPLLLGLLLMALLLMAAWFAPALVVLGGQDGVSAMKLSFAASLRHFGAFLLYGLLILLLAIVASIPLFLGWLIMGPVFIASSYAAYCDLFEAVTPPASG